MNVTFRSPLSLPIHTKTADIDGNHLIVLVCFTAAIGYKGLTFELMFVKYKDVKTDLCSHGQSSLNLVYSLHCFLYCY